MLKNLWFQLHWLLGIVASVVLALVGITGAMLSFEDDILRWLNPGFLTIAELRGACQWRHLAFSRDQQERIYVQHQLSAAASDLQAWINQGAAVYVCGSLEGLEVDATVADVLGATVLERMAAEGLYRRPAPAAPDRCRSRPRRRRPPGAT